ncbi:MAG TPA: hypothetical protein VIN08_12725 [Ohtaekwangia sp.]|uniref:hypothetical protein n=1 Tax=Ohtaekwangia sp. TaxID=2066019 RepID=UPI002F9451CE
MTTAANEHITITKSNELPQAQDYYVLRNAGIQLIQQLGSKLWTDFNLHDPGITILETFCYALTDLSYRASFPVKDLIAEEKSELFNGDAQTLYTAREIFTTAPWTINDYRKLLIDLEGIRNAWIRCSKCNCGPAIYVDCKKSELTYTAPLPPENPKEHEVVPKGLYDVLLELEGNEQNGDLNTGKVSLTYNLLIDGNPETLYLEVRLPSLRAFSKLEQANDTLSNFRDSRTVVDVVNVKTISNNKGAGVDIADSKIAAALRGGLYITLEITIREKVTDPGNYTSHVVELKDIPLRFVFLHSELRKKLTVADIRGILSDASTAGVVARYLQKIEAADKAVAEATKALLDHRNITEDFCCIDEVEIEEIGVCADLELKPEADIEQVLAETYYQIEEYFNPTIRFYRLSEMLEKKTVDEVFNGPKLKHGFVDQEDLDRTSLNRTLYASDIINKLMDIEGVISIKNFVLVRFDAEGNNVGTDPWKLTVSTNHLPRLYLEGSKFLVFKNGLPFLPDTAELMDTMQVIRGRNVMPKLKTHDLDLDIPLGNYYNLKEYYPLQNSLPQVYGTGPEGLPSTATQQRKAQALQLKAYLLFFEQLLVNYLAQLADLKNIFSIQSTVRHTYASAYLTTEIQSDLIGNMQTDFYDSFSADQLQQLTENTDEFLDRRNKFLDHLMARFSESFSEYALLLYSFKNQKTVSQERLIATKTSFLKQFPFQSAYKAQSFNYTEEDALCVKKGLSGIQQRIAVLLGLQPSLNFFDYTITRKDDGYTATLKLLKKNATASEVLLQSPTEFSYEDRDELVRALNIAMAVMLKKIADSSQYVINPAGSKYVIELGTPAIATGALEFDTFSDAEDRIDEIVEFATKYLTDEPFIFIEHILLRPHVDTDALLSVCVDSNCKFCGEEDPYSYQVTFVFNGESELIQDHFEFRRFAERTIRAELPAHVMAKICWVEKTVYDVFEKAYCYWLNAEKDEKSAALKALIEAFNNLKSIYPPPVLHDCIDGNDENRVFLNQTQL